MQKAFSDLAARAKAADEVFIVLIGHGSFDGQKGSFNLPGPDLSADDYAKLLEPVAAQRIVFVNTASSSGAFVQPLAGPGRTIVTSTKTGGEKNEPVFAGYFAEAFKDAAADTDRNGRVSVSEAFEYAKAKVTASYAKAGTILTEHATLDDSREGKFAATLFLESDRARAEKTANVANPELRALLEAQQVLLDGLVQGASKSVIRPPNTRRSWKAADRTRPEGPRHPRPRGGEAETMRIEASRLSALLSLSVATARSATLLFGDESAPSRR